MVTRIVARASLVALCFAFISPLVRAQPAPREGASNGVATSPAPPSGTSPSAPAPATSASAPPPATPRVHHAPPALADEGKPLTLFASLDHADDVRRAFVVYKTDAGVLRSVALLRTDGPSPFAAVIPADDVRGPRLSYDIEVESADGKRFAVFASRDAMHEVLVVADVATTREDALLARLGGRRSVVDASVDVVSFGKTTVVEKTGRVSPPDDYLRVETGYHYRLLRDVAEFGIRLGFVRGNAAVPGSTSRDGDAVGLNYGAPDVRFRLADFVHLDAELLTSVTEVGFSVGGGGALLFGDPYATHFTAGFETVEVFGSRGYARFDVAAPPCLTLAPIVEVTTMPHADRAGLRLLGEVGVDLPAGFHVAVRGGYESRQSAGGGPSLGLTTAYAF